MQLQQVITHVQLVVRNSFYNILLRRIFLHRQETQKLNSFRIEHIVVKEIIVTSLRNFHELCGCWLQNDDPKNAICLYILVYYIIYILSLYQQRRSVVSSNNNSNNTNYYDTTIGDTQKADNKIYNYYESDYYATCNKTEDKNKIKK